MKVYRLKSPPQVSGRTCWSGRLPHRGVRAAGQAAGAEARPVRPADVGAGRRRLPPDFATGKDGNKSEVRLPRASIGRSSRRRTSFDKPVTAGPTPRVQAGRWKLAPRCRRCSRPQVETEPGEEFTALWGTGYDSGRAFVGSSTRAGAAGLLDRPAEDPGEDRPGGQRADAAAGSRSIPPTSARTAGTSRTATWTCRGRTRT